MVKILSLSWLLTGVLSHKRISVLRGTYSSYSWYIYVYIFNIQNNKNTEFGGLVMKIQYIKLRVKLTQHLAVTLSYRSIPFMVSLLQGLWFLVTPTLLRNNCPRKINLFNWLAWDNKILTIENFSNRCCNKLPTTTCILCQAGALSLLFVKTHLATLYSDP